MEQVDNVLKSHQESWEHLLAEVTETPKVKIPLSIFALAIGYATIGFFYAFGIWALGFFMLPVVFARDCFLQLELPWRLKDE